MRDPLERERRVCRFLDSIKDDAAELFLLGDILDYWYEYKYVVPRGYIRFLGKLAELADTGVKITWVTGNHDVWLFDYLRDQIGLTVLYGHTEVMAGGKRVLIAHGDDVGVQPAMYRFTRWCFYNKVCQWLYAGIHPRWTYPIATGWSNENRTRRDPEQQRAISERAAAHLVDYSRDYHAQALTWCGEFVVADKKRLERFASLFGGKAGSGGRDVSRLILAASKSENFPAFRNLCTLQEKLSPYKAKGREYPQRDFGSGTLVSSEGMLTTSSTSPQDTPAKYVHAIDATPCNGDSFVTASKEKEPWALVTLKGTVVLKGVVVENKGRNADQRKRQAPIEIEASDDGKTWRPVYSDEEARETYRADLSRSEMRVRYVRVRRKSAKDNEEPFRLSKILVYGRKLY